MNATFVTLSFLTLTALAGFIYFVHKKWLKQIPYTVLLVGVGIIGGVIVQVFNIQWIQSFQLTPDLLFFVFLPILIFEAAYQVDIKEFYQKMFSISLLALPGLMLGSFIIAIILSLVAMAFGFNIPFLYFLLFGSIISATDPVSVLSLFKTLGAPKKLSLLFEGESLFNDATAVALFSAILGMLIAGTSLSGATTAMMIVSVLGMLFFGIIAGLFFGKIFTYIIERTKENEYSVLVYMLLMVHVVFLLTEIANHFLKHHNIPIEASPIIATTIASLYLGNTVRHSLSKHIESFSHTLWSHLGFLSNSLVFLLVGMLLVQQHIFEPHLLIPAGIAALAATVSRIITTTSLLNWFNTLKIETDIPNTWQKLLAWSGIRGALSVIIVLTVPQDLAIANWPLEATPYQLLVAMVFGSVTASLIVKTISTPWIIKKLGINTLSSKEQAMLVEAQQFITLFKKEKLEASHQKGYVSKNTYNVVATELQTDLSKHKHISKSDFTKIAKHYAYGVELITLYDLFERKEVSKKVFDILYRKIRDQEFLLEYAKATQNICFSERWMHKLIQKESKQKHYTYDCLGIEEKYTYHRSLAIMARKAVNQLQKNAFFKQYGNEVEGEIKRYAEYYEYNVEKMDAIEEGYPAHIQPLLITMAQAMLSKKEQDLLDELVKTHFITNRIKVNY